MEMNPTVNRGYVRSSRAAGAMAPSYNGSTTVFHTVYESSILSGVTISECKSAADGMLWEHAAGGASPSTRTNLKSAVSSMGERFPD